MSSNNPYYGYFREVVGKGSGEYYTGIGQIYKSRRGLTRGYGNFVPGFPYGGRRGLGLGSTLWSLFRMATPILKVLGSKAVDVFSNIAKDGIEGTNIKEAAKKHGKAGISDLVAKIPNAFSGVLNKKGRGTIRGKQSSNKLSLKPVLGLDSGTVTKKHKHSLQNNLISKKKKSNPKTKLDYLYPALNYM